jgi:hypothetical protein
MGFVFGAFVFPIILSLSKGRLSPNGMDFVFDSFVFPIFLSLSKGRLSPSELGVGLFGTQQFRCLRTSIWARLLLNAAWYSRAYPLTASKWP